MYKMILQNGKEFSVETLMDINGVLEIEFSSGTTYAEVAEVYDPMSESFSQEALRKFDLIDGKDEPVGTHIGYTDVQNISAFNGVVKVQVAKENELKTEVAELRELIAVQEEVIADLLMEVWQW